MNMNPALTALSAADPQLRLRAALSVGTTLPDGAITHLITRCAVEPDFFVRDMLTWALTRYPPEETVPALLGELDSTAPQARSQSLHTLSKIGTASGIAPERISDLLHDTDDETARSAWRAAVALTSTGDQVPRLARELVTQLGRGDREMWLSLSRAFVALEELDPHGPVRHILEDMTLKNRPAGTPARVHSEATLRLLDDPDAAFSVGADAVESAKRAAALGPDGAAG